jgi:hypothetical protein
MYSVLKTIADVIGLLAAGITLALLLIGPRVSGPTAKRRIRRWTVVAASLAVAGCGGGILFGALQAQQEKLEVYREPIRSATAQATLLIECDEYFQGTHLVGIRCGFGRGDTPTVATISNQFIALPQTNQSLPTPNGGKRSSLAFKAELDRTVSALPPSVGALASSEYFLITIGSDKIPEGANLVEGTVVLTLNGRLQLEVLIPSQTIHGNKMFVADLSAVFDSFPAAE